MNIHEIRSGPVSQFLTLLFLGEEQIFTGAFDMDGKEKHWPVSPTILRQKATKKHGQSEKKISSDISYLAPGMIVLNQRAFDTLNGVLNQYGQLLRMDCDGNSEYLFNVTNIIDALDTNLSERREGSSSIKKAVFLENRIATTAQIFKVKETVRSALYANLEATRILMDLVNRDRLTGLLLVEPGCRVS